MMTQLVRQTSRLVFCRSLQRNICLTSSITSSKKIYQVPQYESKRGLYQSSTKFPGESFYYHHPEESLDDAPKTGLTAANVFKTDRDILESGEWPWTTGVRSRLPEHYKCYWIELYSKEPIPVHYRKDERKYTVDEFGVRHKVLNMPLPILYLKQSDEGLWGGEGLVIGTRKRGNNPMKIRTPRIWKPKLFRFTFYSEILDKYMLINVTKRALDLIDEAYGFDHYILKTHAVDLRSKLGMTLKREMLLALVNETLYPDDPDRRQEIISKYKDYVIPAEEADWVGLTILEAEEKQLKLEEEQHQVNVRPLKYEYAQELVTDIKEDRLKTDESSWWSKFSPFNEKEDNKRL